jgi:integrase/recombinase XerD
VTVILRKKAISSGKKSLYLDIWHGEKRYYEFLKLYLEPGKPDTNKENLKMAESIRAKKELELNSLEYGYIPNHRKNIDFVDYFQKFHDTYTNKDIRLVRAALAHFKKFLEEKGIQRIPIKSLNADICKEFKSFLEKHLHGETISNYWKKFKAVINKAYKDKLIYENLVEGITIKRDQGLKKGVLSLDEIQLLAKAECGNNEVKRAFLFSLNTGLRFCDVKELSWRNIDNNRLNFTQSKVERSSIRATLSMTLNNNATKLIGDKGKPDEIIFKLPSHNACLKDIKVWLKRAGIEKHITYHSARHSFAVNLLTGKVDVKTVAGLLGHSGLEHVDKYLRYVDERAKDAVNGLPDIEI